MLVDEENEHTMEGALADQMRTYVGTLSQITIIAARRPRRSRLGRKRRLACLEQIGVSIFSMQRRTIARMNPFDHAKAAGDFEVPIGFNRDSSQIRADLFPFGDDRAHQIPRFEASDTTRSLGFASRESMAIHSDHLPRLSALGLNQSGTNFFK